MVEIQIEYTGNLRTRAVHGPSGTVLETDAPTDNQGLGERFSPTDLLATALGSCALTIMGIAARKMGASLEGARVRVEKHMADQPARRIGRLVVEYRLPATLTPPQRAILEKIATACPVFRSLHPDIQIENRFV
ncbi:MAG: OsmC family protein [Myxococcales bacterium]|nr:OsmC family protein [Myxococcales bacterium]